MLALICAGDTSLFYSHPIIMKMFIVNHLCHDTSYFTNITAISFDFSLQMNKPILASTLTTLLRHIL